MTVVAVDDTDSRTEGMCTTYLAARLAERLDGVERSVLVRLSPAVEHKTRGNAAVAVHTTAPPERARAAAVDLVEAFALVGDASPGVVVFGGDPTAVPAAVAQFARDAVRRPCAPERALQLLADIECEAVGWGGGEQVRGGERDPGGAETKESDLIGRGRVGALAAVGAWRAFDEWTYERIDYREFERCGTPRELDERSVFAAAADGFPAAWDTVDRVAGEPVCVPNAPGPILYGVRGDDPDAVDRVADRIDAEPVARSAVFHTNQGTDAHLQPGEIGRLRADRAYRVTAVVCESPETRAGGHVFFEVADEREVTDNDTTLDCVAFEPTKRFRDRVRKLRVGDRVTICGEYDGTLKLEKFALRELNRTRRVVPTCECERSMESAGRGQRYRCRDCGARAPGKETVRVDRDLKQGWYEVPPRARRHVARPLVRGGFDAPTHPEW